MSFKLPPIEKIYEAYGAIADERINLEEKQAKVESSNHSKEYVVTWNDNIYTSNDSASYWQGYMGYPIIAVLMLKGVLPLDMEIAGYFKGIPWKQLNTEYKNKYSEVIEKIMNDLNNQGIDCGKIKNEVDYVYSRIKELDFTVKRSSLRPPK